MFKQIEIIETPLSDLPVGSATKAAVKNGCASAALEKVLQVEHSKIDGVVLEHEDVLKLLEKGGIFCDTAGEVQLPDDATFVNVNFSEVLDKVPYSKSIEKGFRPVPEDKNLSFFGATIIGCKIPGRSLIENSLIVGSQQVPTFIGGNCLITDSAISGSVATHHNCLLVNCQGNDGVDIGYANKLIGSAGDYKGCNIGHESEIISGSFSQNRYDVGVSSKVPTLKAWNNVVSSFNESASSLFIEVNSPIKDPDEVHGLNVPDLHFTRPAMFIVSSDLSKKEQFPAFNEGEIHKSNHIRYKGEITTYDKVAESMNNDFLVQMKEVKTAKLNSLLHDNEEIVSEVVSGFIAEHMPGKVNAQLFVEAQPELPQTNKEVIGKVSRTITEGITHNFTEQNSHARLDNDHSLASKIAEKLNSSLSQFGESKKVKKEAVKEMIVQLASQIKGLDQFDVVSKKEADPQFERILPGKGGVAFLSKDDFEQMLEERRQMNKEAWMNLPDDDIKISTKEQDLGPQVPLL